MDQLLNKDPTELFYTERTVFRKDVNTNNSWTFELGKSGGEAAQSKPTFHFITLFTSFFTRAIIT